VIRVLRHDRSEAERRRRLRLRSRESPARGATQNVLTVKHRAGQKRKGSSITMIKSELIGRLATKNPDLYQRDVENAVDAILGVIKASLCRRDRVEIRGFGVFSVRKRGARTGRNPRSDAAVTVPPKSLPFFRTGREMNQRLNRRES